MTGTLEQYIAANARPWRETWQDLFDTAVTGNLLQQWIRTNSEDGVTFKAKFLTQNAGNDPHVRQEAFNDICTMLGAIGNQMLQDEYVKTVAGIMDVKQSTINAKIKGDKDNKVDQKKLTDELKRVAYVCQQVEKKVIDMTSEEGDLQEIANALASLGENARDYFHRICSVRPEYIRSGLDPVFTEALEKSKYRNASKFFKLAEVYGLEVKIPKTIKDVKEKRTVTDIIGDESLADDYQKYGIYEEDGVYKSLDMYEVPYVVSNFKMRILWHVETSDDAAYRLIAIENIYGHKAVINMNTDNFVSVGSFKKEVARKGNFIWKGNDIDLTRLQDKLQRDEKPTDLVKNLGWHRKGKFYAFANGIFDVNTDEFLGIDEYGIVKHTVSGPDEKEYEKNYFIPAMSKIYADKEDKFANDKKFIYQHSNTTWHEWSKQFTMVYGYQGEIALVFYLMCLYSDIIFKDLDGRFPLLFVYGKRGTGKGTMVGSLMRMFGHGQDQIMLGGSTTSVGFMRKFAQFINGIVWLDEYKNNLPAKIIESIKNIFDRVGYERGKKDNTFETESTPVYSGCILSGQEMPTIEPALFTRGILASLTESKFTEAQRENFRQLKRMEAGGLSCITVTLLKHRPHFAARFKDVYEEELRRLIRNAGNNDIDERLFVNYAAMIATADIINAILPMPFNMTTFRDMMKRNLLEQFFVLKGSDDTSKFWDIVEQLFHAGIIQEDKHFILKNGKVYLRVKEVFPYYAKALIERRDPNGLDLQTLTKYLESDPKSFVGREKKWFAKQGQQLWCQVFKYVETGIDLITANTEEELERKYKDMDMEYVREDGMGAQTKLHLVKKDEQPKKEHQRYFDADPDGDDQEPEEREVDI